MNKRRGSGPNVEWVGVVVRTDDGNVHAVELHATVANFVTADLIIRTLGRAIREVTCEAIEGEVL